MNEVLVALFDAWPAPVLLVSSYDGTITYANQAAGPGGIGQDIAEWRPTFHDEPVGQVLGSGPACVARPDGDGFRVASRLDQPHPVEVLETVHPGVTEAEAVRLHELMAVRTVAAIEFVTVRRLVGIAQGALDELTPHMARLEQQLLQSAATSWPAPLRLVQQHVS